MFEPSPLIDTLLTAVTAQPAASAGLGAIISRVAEFTDPLQARLTGVALDPAGRICAGRIWVDHGGLLAGLDVRARIAGVPFGGTPLGGVLRVRRGTKVELVIDIDLAHMPNWAQFVPTLARVDVIAGDVTGPASDRDVFTTPATKVVKSFDVTPGTGHVSFTYSFGEVDRPFYVRVRGTDGKRSAPGYLGAGVDPVGPAMDVVGSADPWLDLWFYANPIWILPNQ